MMMDDRRSAMDAYTQMSEEHLCEVMRHRVTLRLGRDRGEFSLTREKHFMARLEWFTCVNRMLELSLPRTLFRLGEKLEHYDAHRLGI